MVRRYRCMFVIAVLLALTTEAFACGAGSPTASSPDRRIRLAFCLDEEGAPKYSVTVDGRPALEDSALGLRLVLFPALEKGFKIAKTVRRSFDETWEQVWGEERFIRNHYNEMKIELAEDNDFGRELFVYFRVFNDGIGLRYEIPTQFHLRDFEIDDELTEFNFPGDPQAWSIDAYADADYEQHYKRVPTSEMPASMTPLTLEVNGLYFSLHEANLTNFAGMFIDRSGPGRLKAALYPWSDNSKVHATTPMLSPWRTIQIARQPGDLITSYLILNLNEPNKIKDTSWIKPQKYLGIWWAMHIGKYSWSSGPLHGATTAHAKQYIDAAKKLKMPGLLIEGWNVGWDGDWGKAFSFTKSYDDFNLVEVASYAKANGVQIIGHHETAAAVLNYESQVDDAFKLYESVGIHSVKTGYVGRRMDGVDWRHGQRMVQHHQMIADKAAQHKIMLDIHEPIKDTGLRRTYPNIMTREGACGQEYDAWGGANHNPPSHAAILPFTRSLSGPFDYTPGIFDLLKGATPENRVRTTLAKQLALYLTIYSPLHMAADLPENYFGHPAFKFIQDVPTDWHTTRVLNGRIGEYVTIARRDRHSLDWYLGSVTNEKPRALGIDLGFLEAGRMYRAEIYADAKDSDYLTNPQAYEIKTALVHRGQRWMIHLAPGGGQAIRFVALPKRK